MAQEQHLILPDAGSPTLAGTASYQYRPLRRSVGNIRLLKILPTEGRGTPLSCQMITDSLENPTTAYEAISYVWGDPTPCVALNVNGRQLLVPASSDAALRRLAQPDQERVVWIDAVCINQTDLEERSTQVSIMGTIFKQAAAVLVYLGESDDYTDQAVANIIAISQEIDEQAGLSYDLTRETYCTILTAHHRLLRTELAYEALTALFRRTWFRRVWVVQDFAIAKHSRALCVAHVFDMHAVLRVAFWLREWYAGDIGTTLGDCLMGIYRMWIAHVDSRWHKGMTLSQALLISRPREALDPRDRVFAMLGLLKPELLHTRISPDYNKSTEHVFRDFVRQYVIAEGQLSIFSFISHRTMNELEDSRFCSWAPRLDRAWAVDLDGNEMQTAKDVFGSMSRTRPFADTFDDPDSLTICGLAVGEITDSIGGPKNYDGSYDSSAWKQVNTSIAARGIEKDALARTLIQDQVIEKVRDLTDHDGITAFQSWSQHLQDGRYIPPVHIARAIASIDTTTKEASFYKDLVVNTCRHRQLCVTDHKALGLFPKLSQPGDKVVVANGPRCPLLLRPRGNHHLLLGECYLDEYMPWQERGEEISKGLLDGEGELFDLR